MWLAICGTVFAFTIIFHLYVSRRSSRLKKKAKEGGLKIHGRRALIVVAHPDDECMFFGPTILALLKESIDVHLLCLSSGNFRRQGLVRKVELRHSCQLLGIPLGNITVVEHTKLPDDPTLLWNKQIIRDVVLKYIEQMTIDIVISFDGYGVSGHSNHVAIHKALQHMFAKGMFPSRTSVFVLQSVSLFRKYSGLLDTLATYLDGATHVFVCDYFEILKCQRAMLSYRSQLTWYRILYIIFSRYMVVNSLRWITMGDRYYTFLDNLAKKTS